MIRRAVILVADGAGCGAAPDAAAFGDEGANTLGNLARAVGGLALPNLQALGLGHVTELVGVAPVRPAAGAYGVMTEISAGKDTITGHWEMAGVVLQHPMATFPHGFPEEITRPLQEAAGRGLLGNKPASGTEIIAELGEQHLRTGDIIVYTSADSVLQIAAHEDVVPVPELYRICQEARLIADRAQIGRVIARPFVGAPGAFRRTYNRRDFSLPAPASTLCDVLTAAGIQVTGVGKIGEIFAGRGIAESLHSEGNADGMRLMLEALGRLQRGLLFVNLVDFDMLYGHRNDCEGFHRGLRELDSWLPTLQAALGPGDVVFVTADHGNDPTTPGTDHNRERVPLLVFGPGVPAVDLGVREAFCDLGQTIADGFGLKLECGRSFLAELQL